MSPAKMRLLAFLVTFGPALLLMSARPATVESLPILAASLLEEGGLQAPSVGCGGKSLGKGWCGSLTCADGGSCSANWKSIANESCMARCTGPSWNCCGWQINTSESCGCVDDGAEPASYKCGPCEKKYEELWQ